MLEVCVSKGEPESKHTLSRLAVSPVRPRGVEPTVPDMQKDRLSLEADLRTISMQVEAIWPPATMGEREADVLVLGVRQVDRVDNLLRGHDDSAQVTNPTAS